MERCELEENHEDDDVDTLKFKYSEYLTCKDKNLPRCPGWNTDC